MSGYAVAGNQKGPGRATSTHGAACWQATGLRALTVADRDLIACLIGQRKQQRED